MHASAQSQFLLDFSPLCIFKCLSHNTQVLHGCTSVHIILGVKFVKRNDKYWECSQLYQVLEGCTPVHSPNSCCPRSWVCPTQASGRFYSNPETWFVSYFPYLTNGPVCFLQQGGLNNWNKHSVSRSLPSTDGQGPLQATYAELLLRLSLR